MWLVPTPSVTLPSLCSDKLALWVKSCHHPLSPFPQTGSDAIWASHWIWTSAAKKHFNISVSKNKQWQEFSFVLSMHRKTYWHEIEDFNSVLMKSSSYSNPSELGVRAVACNDKLNCWQKPVSRISFIKSCNLSNRNKVDWPREGTVRTNMTCWLGQNI